MIKTHPKCDDFKPHGFVWSGRPRPLPLTLNLTFASLPEKIESISDLDTHSKCDEFNRRNVLDESIPDGTGYIPGLDGRLNPILDDQGRTYLYAQNIAIEGGKAQPVPFTVGRPFDVKDSHGHEFRLTIIDVVGSSSLVEFSSLGGSEPAFELTGSAIAEQWRVGHFLREVKRGFVF